MDSEQQEEVLRLAIGSAEAFLSNCHSKGRLRELASPTDLWPDLVDLGITLIALPEEDDGFAGGIAGAGQIARLFGRELVPEPIVCQAIMPAALAAALPPGHELRSAISQALQPGGRRIALAWEETSPVERKPSSVILKMGGLHGTKRLVSQPAEQFIVSANRDGETVLCLIDGTAAGVHIEECRLLSGGVCATLDLTDVRLGDGPVIGGEVATMALNRALEFGTLATAAQLLGIAEGAFDLTVQYLKLRSQFGQPIGSFQALQHRAVDLLMAISLARASWSHAAQCWESSCDGPDTLAAISAAKARASDTVRQVIREAVQLHGAVGFTHEADIGLYVRAGLGLSNVMGSSAVHRARFLSIEAAA